MKAIAYSTYGPPEVLRYEEVEKPEIGDDEVLIKVHAAAVNPLDWHFMRGLPYFLRVATGLHRPNAPLGVDAAGTVEAIGENVTQFNYGDEVFGACRGAFAEYARAHASTLAIKPGNITFEQAACLNVAGLTALQGLRDKGQVRPAEKVLINGAAGGVGTLAIQIAKWLGADVTGVCSASNVDLVRSIGADRVIDYANENFTLGSERYDLIFDCIGNHPLSALRRVLNPKGRYLAVGGPTGDWMLGFLARGIAGAAMSIFGRQKLSIVTVKRSQQDLVLLGELIQTGKIRPIIDRRCGLKDVPEAIRYVEQGHARGKVVIAMGS